MDKKALGLVLAVYRVTKLFPEGEVLISQMRETANHILSEVVLRRNKEVVKNIKVLLNYFEIARAQKWIEDINFDILIKEYNDLINNINISDIKEKKVKKEKNNGLTQRQGKILEKIKNSEKFRLKDLNGYFPNLNPRTLMRDLDFLRNKGYIIREGYGRGSYYKITT